MDSLSYFIGEFLSMSRFLILGAGPCGLGAAFRLNEIGERDWLILEQSNHPGGLASSFTDENGFTWDIGGHVQFSHYADFDRVMQNALPDGWLHHVRESWVWMYDRFVPYPFQNNLWRLPESEQKKCVEGLIAAQKRIGSLPANFGEWIDQSFGEGIASIFMRPYNYKVWAYQPEAMSYQWIGERVARVDLERVQKNIAEKKDDVSWGPNATFQFPKRGGTGAIWKSVAKMTGEDKIKYNAEVVAIDKKNKTVQLKSGEKFQYQTLLSTLPLDRLCEFTQTPMVGKLKSSNSHIVGVGIEGIIPEQLKTKCWMYFPEANTPFYRATVFSNYSPENVPDSKKYWSLMCEVSSSEVKRLEESDLINSVVRGLKEIGFITDEKKIASLWAYSARPGYPTPSLGRDQILQDAFEKLEFHHIYSRGRFGGWKYEVSNQDHTFMQGFEWADFIARGIPEDTIQDPARVNAPGGMPARKLF